MQISPGRTHAFLLAASVPLYFGTLLNDWAYWTSHQIQWSNFASWLLVFALIFGGVALAFAIADWVRNRHGGTGLRILLQAVLWVLGFFNALVHARDAWAVMPTGLLLSVICALLAVVIGWLVFAALPPATLRLQTFREGGVP